MAFYKLYKARKDEPGEYLPTWRFLGEMHIEELDEWVLMSYKCPARLSDIHKENPNLLDRKIITGKSGATYYGYKFKDNVQAGDIADSSLFEFYKSIKK